MMGLEAWLTLATIFISLSALMVTRWRAEVVLLAAVGFLLLAGVLTVPQALAGFANEGLATVALLYVVAAGLTHTGIIGQMTHKLLGQPKSIPQSQARLMLPVAAVSSLLNNTPVVAMLIPAISEWAKRHNLSVSQFMMPLSYAAIVGGCCTLVGTSTNLVVNGMMKASASHASLGLFELAWIGVPLVIATVIYVLLFSSWLLPNRTAAARPFDDSRQYMLAMQVEAFSNVAGKTIEEAGLRQLPGLYLTEIQRRGSVLAAVSPSEVLYADDVLLFAGDVDAVVDLKRFRGLKLADDQAARLDSETHQRCMVEVVISTNFPSLGKTVRDSQFRNRYNAAIVAVARDGEILRQRIGDVALRPGDTLLLETDQDFVSREKNSRDFLLISGVENSTPLRYEKGGFALLSLFAMIGLVMYLDWPMFSAAVAASGIMLVTRCLGFADVGNAIKWDVLLVIAASLALGMAVQESGLAAYLAAKVIALANGSAMFSLVMIFILTAGLSALISNLAAAVIIFPIMAAAAEGMGVSVVPFAVVLMIAASASFATPIGYQTNLMVYGPGDYRFKDFLKMGLPLTVLVGVITVTLVPYVWPF